MYMWVIRKVFSKLQRKGCVRIVDLFGGVTDYSKRSTYRYSRFCLQLRRSPEIFAFTVAKELEKKGYLEVVFRDGRNWLVLKPTYISLERLFSEPRSVSSMEEIENAM